MINPSTTPAVSGFDAVSSLVQSSLGSLPPHLEGAPTLTLTIGSPMSVFVLPTTPEDPCHGESTSILFHCRASAALTAAIDQGCALGVDFSAGRAQLDNLQVKTTPLPWLLQPDSAAQFTLAAHPYTWIMEPTTVSITAQVNPQRCTGQCKVSISTISLYVSATHIECFSVLLSDWKPSKLFCLPQTSALDHAAGDKIERNDSLRSRSSQSIQPSGSASYYDLRGSFSVADIVLHLLDSSTVLCGTPVLFAGVKNLCTQVCANPQDWNASFKFIFAGLMTYYAEKCLFENVVNKSTWSVSYRWQLPSSGAADVEHSEPDIPKSTTSTVNTIGSHLQVEISSLEFLLSPTSIHSVLRCQQLLQLSPGASSASHDRLPLVQVSNFTGLSLELIQEQATTRAGAGGAWCPELLLPHGVTKELDFSLNSLQLHGDYGLLVSVDGFASYCKIPLTCVGKLNFVLDEHNLVADVQFCGVCRLIHFRSSYQVVNLTHTDLFVEGVGSITSGQTGSVPVTKTLQPLEIRMRPSNCNDPLCGMTQASLEMMRRKGAHAQTVEFMSPAGCHYLVISIHMNESSVQDCMFEIMAPFQLKNDTKLPLALCALSGAVSAGSLMHFPADAESVIVAPDTTWDILHYNPVHALFLKCSLVQVHLLQ